MPISRAKSVDRLYEDCREYDLVLVPDPPMGDAINRRLDEPQFGPFATTPRRLAAGGRVAGEDRQAFLEVIDETDLNWKAAAYAVGNVLQCWEQEASLEAIREYDTYATPATDAVIECLQELDTTSKRLDEHQIPDDTNVAVVGIEEFTPLERSILPGDYDVIAPLTDEALDPPTFRIFDTSAGIVDTILGTVTAENADRVAIVLHRGSDYAPLVEAALETGDVPYYGGPGFVDHPDHRTFLRLLRTAHSGRDLRVGDVRPILERVGGEIDVDHDEKRVHTLDHDAAEWLREFTDGLEERTFDAALRVFEYAAEVDLGSFRDELDRLGLLSELVTDAAVSRLEFYLEAYEVPVDREDEGVLLADATAAGTVDRPAVFYLGLDQDWTHATPRRPWVDAEREYTKHLQQFQRLLQNGMVQYYLVQDERNGRAVTPCLYFEELLDAEFERFSDLEAERCAPRARTAGHGFDRDPLGTAPNRIETVSQSMLQQFVNCPRDQLFASLVDQPEKVYFKRGSLFHGFAEVYAQHGDRIDAAAIETVTELMAAETRPFLLDVDEPVNRTFYRIGLETIVDFLEADPPVGAPFAEDRGWGSNRVATHLDLSHDAPYAEWWFEHAELGIQGKVDLVHSPTRFVDYKSTDGSTARTVVKQSALDPPDDTPNFQAIQYLTYLRSETPSESLEFTFLYLREVLDDAVTGTVTLEDAITTVTYHPEEFESYIAKREIFEELRERAANKCQKTFGQLEYEDYAEVLGAHPFPDTRDSEDLMASPLGQALLERAQDLVGEYVYVETGCAQAMRHLRDIRDTAFFADDLDAYETFVMERIDEINRYRAGRDRYPVEGLGGEPNWRRVDNRDMILEGDA